MPHREGYYKERHRDRKEKLVELLGGQCADCGYNHISGLEFHHRDTSDKLFSLSTHLKDKPWQELVTEALKCVLLCSNCHKLRHWQLKADRS